MTEKHDCFDYLLAIHAEGSDTRHKIQGVLCPCLPELRCGLCDQVLLALGELGLEAVRKNRLAVHIYPAGLEELQSDINLS